MVTVKNIPNIWAPQDCRISKAEPGHAVTAYAPDGFDFAMGRIEVNGTDLDIKEYGRRVKDGDVLVFMTVPAAEGIGASILVSLVLAAVSTGISYALRPNAPSLSRRGVDEDEAKPQPEFSGVQTTVGSGKVISWVAGGPIRIGGHTIESFTDADFETVPDTIGDAEMVARAQSAAPGSQALNTRIAWGWGPYDSIGFSSISNCPMLS